MGRSAKETAEKIKQNIEQVIVGKSEIIDLFMVALLADGHILLEDVPGTGKTKLAKSMAASIDGVFKRIQFTPDLLPTDVTGLNIYSQKESDFVFKAGPVFANVLLADEINRATPRTQSGLLECMEERQVTIDGITYPLPETFMVIATQNPVETAGTFPLPEAQMDRFLMQLSMGSPTKEEEVAILARFMEKDPLDELKPVCSREEIRQAREESAGIYVHPLVMSYMAEITGKTRESEKVDLGVSPRGTLALLRASKAYAAIKGKSYVTPDDVKKLVLPVLSHRLILSGSYGRTGEAVKVMKRVVSEVEVPTEDFSRQG